MSHEDFKRLARQLYAAASEVGKALLPIIEQQRRLATEMAPLVENARRMNELMLPIAQQAAQFQQQIAPYVEQIRRAFQELPERNRKALRILAVNGWYLDPELPLADLFEIVELFETDEKDKANERLCFHFQARCEELCDDLSLRFPTRARVLGKAFEAHVGREYALSIPVFLAQADGICQELVGIQLYTKRDGVPLLAAHFNVENESAYLASFLYPIIEPTPITAGPMERSSVPDMLNRHAVLHGEVSDYDTERNSCRALSLLSYVVWVLNKLTSEIV